jgi:hypothetical protein
LPYFRDQEGYENKVPRRDMFRRTHAYARPGWTAGAGDDATEILAQRRWRIMQSVLPFDNSLTPLPTWVRTPDQFVGWLSCRVEHVALRAYFREVQTIAKQTCDLELLRFARKYLGEI